MRGEVDRLVSVWTALELILNKPSLSELNYMKFQGPRISFDMTQSELPQLSLFTICTSVISVSRS
jgi:hypothetical protein